MKLKKSSKNLRSNKIFHIENSFDEKKKKEAKVNLRAK